MCNGLITGGIAIVCNYVCVARECLAGLLVNFRARLFLCCISSFVVVTRSVCRLSKFRRFNVVRYRGSIYVTVRKVLKGISTLTSVYRGLVPRASSVSNGLFTINVTRLILYMRLNRTLMFTRLCGNRIGTGFNDRVFCVLYL